MSSQNVHHHVFPNGLTLLLESMEDVRSAAFAFLMPAGCAYDPPGQNGLASLLTEMLTRGAGERDSRTLQFDLDNMGLHRSESVGSYHVQLWGATLAKHVPEALKTYRDVLRQPHFPDDELDAVKSLLLQDILSLEDEPGRKLGIELRKRYLPIPLCNETSGTKEGVESVTIQGIREQYKRLFHPRDCILSVAGNVEWAPLRDQVEELFGDWEAKPRDPLLIGEQTGESAHLRKDTSQTWIAMACPSVPVGHDDYYAVLGAVNVLSGGMSARLFTEVREKRGLCYAVGASYLSFKDRAHVFGSANTRNEKAQETLEAMLHEFRRLRDGIEEDELDRMKAGVKSSLIMQQESTSARAAALASDWYYLGRIRMLEERRKAVDALTADAIVGYLERYPLEEFVIVTLGPDELRVPTPLAS